MKRPTLPSIRFGVTRDTEVLHSIDPTEPDPDWRFIDAAGHGHFHSNGYPTLKEVTEPCFDADSGDQWDRHVRFECPHCGEVIVPGRRAAAPVYVHGPECYTIDGREVSPDEYADQWSRAWHASIDAAAERFRADA